MTVRTTDRRLRYIEDEFHLRCEYCAQYWPLTTDFWIPNLGLRRCRGCWAEYKRFKEAARRAGEDYEPYRSAKKFKDAMYYQANRERLLAANLAWKAAHREQIAAYNARYRLRKRAEKAA